jgi:cell wall-associated NlpC family hydrolase
MARKTLVKDEVDGYKYFLKKNGKAAKNRWVTYQMQHYYVGSDFRVVTDDYVDGYYVDAEGVRGGSAVAKEGDDLSPAAVEEDVVDYGDTTGADIAEYAVQFVGNPYVYGGTSLTNGADCSGFAFAVFKHFGISLLRTANEQMKGPSQAQINSGYTSGYSVSKSDLQPGDLVFYGASGYSSHVAIYIGNDEVVHAVNSQTGIKVTSITHTGVPIKYMRYWS